MKKSCLALGLAALATLSSCAAGPHQLARTVDDWDHEMYIENPIVNGVLHFIPVIPFAGFAAAVGDFFVTDAYSFWFKDVWDGKGTGFTHYNPTPTDGAMDSLLIDDAKFLEVR